MPLGAPRYGPEVAVPWLMNLLPEGEPLRAMTRALGVARDDVLGLIAETGRDLAGALTIGAPSTADKPGYRKIDGGRDLERIIAELPSKPFLMGDDGVSMSLAGAQEKLPVALVDGSVAIPVNGASSTHILKPDNPRLIGSVQNEALCMVLAGRCGLRVAPVTTGMAGERSYLLVQRYDRAGEGDGVRRLHQEDFCQALGRPPAAKYEHNGSGVRGPSLPEMFALVRAHMTARDINGLLDAVIFNIAIGNVDSHAKNYSILLRPRRIELAPLYDMMSGLDWPNITQNHAQDVDDQRRGRHIYARHWRRMAEACGLSKPGVLRRIDALTARLLAELPTAVDQVASMPAGPDRMLAIFSESIGTRASLVQANAKRDGDDVEPPDAELPAQDRTHGDV
jgi:serine/threonine-protein kinase HipA